MDCEPSLRQSPQPSTGLSNCGQDIHPSVENMDTVLPHCTAQPLSTDGTTEQECDLWFSFSHRKKLTGEKEKEKKMWAGIAVASQTGQMSTCLLAWIRLV